MANVRVRLNGSGMSELLKSDAVRALLEAPAQATLQRAIDDPHDDTYEFERRLTIIDETTDRAVKRIGSTAPHAVFVEVQFGVMKRALGA